MGRNIIYLAILFNLFIPSQSFAQDIKVSVSVPLSDIWANSVSNNSEILNNKSGDLITYKIISKGYENELLKNNKILVEVYKDGKGIYKSIVNSNRVNTYKLKDNGAYKISFKDITWERPVELKKELKYYKGTNLIARLFNNLN